MNESYSSPSPRGTHLSSKELRKMKKKALQSYKKIHTIQNIAESETRTAAREADDALDKFIQKI